MVAAYLDAYKIEVEGEDMRRQALQWAMERGARSGRVAWQYVQQVRARQPS